MLKLRSFSSLFVAVCVVVGAPGLAAAKHRAKTAPPQDAPPPVVAPNTAPSPVAAPPLAAPKTAPSRVAPPLAAPKTAPSPVAAPQVPGASVPAAVVGAPTRVSFGPAAPGTGSVSVKGDGMHVSFDGRDMGAAPLTITDIPKGDYVVEGTGADGKQVSRPVTIDEGAEATVDLGAGIITTEAPVVPVVDEGHPRLLMAAKVMLGVSAVALVAGAVFGVLELKQHSDYESAPAMQQSTLDGMAQTGQRYAAIANVSFVACGVSLLAAGALALPTYLHREQPAQPTTTAFISAGGSRGATLAGFSIRF
jgi:hypothetical protein